MRSYTEIPATTLRILSKPSGYQTWKYLAIDWLTIIASVGVAKYFSNPLIYFCSVAIIAAKQHALLVLMHSAAHWQFFRSRKWNDWVSNIFTAWPLFVSTHAYREHHLAHHLYTNTDKDPDWVRKVRDPKWQFPQQPKHFYKNFLPYLYGLGILEMAFAIKILCGSPKNSYFKKELTFRAIYYISIITTFCALGVGKDVFYYWIVPYFTILPLLMKVRSIVEHLGLPNNHELNGSRNIIGSKIEIFLFGPHGNALHLVHHLYPSVTWYGLEDLQNTLLQCNDYKKLAHQNTSYFFSSPYPARKDLISSSGLRKESYDYKASA